MEDVDSFDRVKAEEEVAKFMLDAEMVNLYIQYGKEVERDPTFVVPDTEKDEDGIFSFRTVVILYLGYVAYDSFPRIFRNWVYDQQLQGTWKGTNIQLIDEWIQKTEPAISAARAAAAAAAADATATISAVGDTLQQQQTIADSFIQNSALPDAMIQLSMESLVTTVQTATQTLMMT